ncbi:MAG: S10 family peptidase [Rhodanobacteraceae bacterium]
MKNLLPATCGLVATIALALCATPALAKDHNPKSGNDHATPQATVKSQQSVTQGSVTVDGKSIPYKAIAGVMVVKNGKGKPYVDMSYVAYIKRGVHNETQRPITFFYNGGPGSSTVWLHMLAFGPKMAVTGNGTQTPPAPYKLVNNDDSLLNVTDEVFIDAPGTGFGKIITKKMGGVGTPKMVYGTAADAQTFARFVQQYITLHNRWNSPKFLYGESYGTTRDAVLAYDLTREDDIELNGVVFQSAVLNWNLMLDFPKAEPGITLAYATGLPSEAATAWYHHKVPDQPQHLQPFLHQVEQFAMGPYLEALDEGDLLSATTKQKIAETMHQDLGLPTAYIVRANLRIDDGMFRHELLGKSDEITGRLDTRYIGFDFDPMAENAEYSPLMTAIGSPTMALFNEYVRNTLKFGTGMTYKPMTNAIEHWKYNITEPGMHFTLPFTVNVMPFIADAMKLNPNMKVMLTGGYFDVGTPFYAAKYEFEHLALPPKLQSNISYHFFQSGHMVYLNPKAHKDLTDATAAFIKANS